jgi:hypothetical protein
MGNVRYLLKVARSPELLNTILRNETLSTLPPPVLLDLAQKLTASYRLPSQFLALFPHLKDFGQRLATDGQLSEQEVSEMVRFLHDGAAYVDAGYAR